MVFQFRTCTGGEIFSQTKNGQSIAVSIGGDDGAMTISWNDGSGEQEVTAGAGFNDNRWTMAEFVFNGEALVVGLRDDTARVGTVIRDPSLLGLDLSGTDLVVGSGFTGCLEEVSGLSLAGATDYEDVTWGECALENQYDCGAQDPCRSQPCQNNGVCRTEGSDFICQCPSRFNGTLCEDDLGPLCSDPEFQLNCVNGTCAEDGISNGTLCSCEPGFGGLLCDVASTVCDNDPCANGGTCQTSSGAGSGFLCFCSAGYNGSTCDTNIDDCEVNPCLNGGTCQDAVNSYSCDCTSTGYTGSLCEQPDDECSDSPCQNSGVCTDTLGGYYCNCTAGNYGVDCTENLCSYATPCQNGATCTSEQGVINCTCAAGFEGDLCEINIDECDPNPCQNGGICRDGVNEFECFCPNEFEGETCEIDLDTCSVQFSTCKNGATCIDLPQGHRCNCAPGYTDATCATNIDECESSPCVNNATCKDLINSYECLCAAGFNGTNCEQNINECASNPCSNGGECIDEVNGFTCDCTDTGFEGLFCDDNIDDCAFSPCQNNATCVDGIKYYNCSCFDGYEGVDCEIDIPECASSPCDNGGTCLELSNQTLYDSPYQQYLPDVFQYSNASGFVCVCVAGYSGVNCEININECASMPCRNGECIDGVNGYTCNCTAGYDGTTCENNINECASDPCRNGGTCEDLVNAFRCHCTEGWGSSQCDVALTACIGNTQCQNGATCDPYYDEAQDSQEFTCLCTAGFTGNLCDVNTASSFRGTEGKYLRYGFSSSDTPFQFTFSFATTIPNGHLLLGSSFSDTLVLEMLEGNLSLSVRDSVAPFPYLIEIGSALNDGEWHTVEVSLFSGSHMALNVTSESCDGGLCSDMVTFSEVIGPFSVVYFGHAPTPNDLAGSNNEPFTGCMRDIFLGDDSGNPLLSTGAGDDPEVGCSRMAQCQPDPCYDRGSCTDLWWTYSCDCQLGYTGLSCETSFTQATFSFENTTSYAIFDISGYSVSVDEHIVRVIFRTREAAGLLFFAASGQDYISLVVDNSTALAEVSSGGTTQSLRISRAVLDGRYHTLELTWAQDMVTLALDSSSSETTGLQVGGSFGEMFVGGVPDFTAGSLPAIVQGSEPFKGCLWDLKFNNYSLEFFPLPDNLPGVEVNSIAMAMSSSGVVEMCNSDDTCNPEPCENGGVCQITWNDFECDCPNGYGGKNCSLETVCSTDPCPLEATCVDRDGGFECVTPATFDGTSSVVTYDNTINATRELDTVSFMLRTRQSDGLVLHASNSLSGRFLTLEIRDSRLLVRLDLGTPADVSSSSSVADGVWHDVAIEIGSYEVILMLDDGNDTVSVQQEGSLKDVIVDAGSGPVYLGNTNFTNNRYFTMYTPFEGNLNDVRIGTFLLPFFNESAYNVTVEERFIMEEMVGVTIGSDGADVCASDPCRNGANCTDDWNAYSCVCAPGYSGADCGTEIDECVSNPCQFGSYCNDLVNGYNCSCTPGYEGFNCSIEIDECESTPCLNDGMCNDGVNGFTCVCVTEFTGRMCEFNTSATCAGDPCLNGGSCTDDPSAQPGSDAFTCTCVDGFEGTRCAYETDYCQNVTCQNGATCVSDNQQLTYVCQCLPGYAGDLCDTNVDDCLGVTCENGGTCEDGVAEYNCVCAAGFEGQTCAVDIDECTSSPCVVGTCNDGVNGFSCNCPPGYEGDRCELRGPCVNGPCQNGGLCSQELVSGSFSFECYCPTGFNATYCENEIDWCDSNPCQQAGSNCTSDRERFYCACAPGYGGVTCEIKLPNCDSEFCSNGASCTDLPYDYVCTCAPGWTGKNCTLDINECESEPCENGTPCLNLQNDYFCDCTDSGFLGKNCSVDYPDCNDTTLCQNGGTCQEEPGSFKCECADGFIGTVCDEMDHCFSAPCQNGGQCSNAGSTYRCDCVNGYSGTDCTQASTNLWIIIGASIAAGVILIIIIILISCFVCSVRKKRATQGSYSPSRQEMSGSFVEMDNVLKMPPEERLI
ncbi:uncharacterized protein [Diadema setosum]|uniref:uncharacterized protein n=1 Tax=Diadema setosum TaxID=31175 RepID=UPI003B3A2A03